ncbi:MAG: vWA domain-containing protein [Phyllobacterium sp.]
MSAPELLPRAARPFVEFSTLLRANGFLVSPEQTQTFIQAVGLLGPNTVADIHKAGLATLAPPPERREEFDASFRLLFLGQSIAAGANVDEEEELRAYDERDGEMDPPEAEEINESGEEATGAETLSLRQFADVDESEVLRRFRRLAPSHMPRRKTYRRAAKKAGDCWNMRKLLRDAVKRDGEVMRLPKLARKTRQRRILLLVDVSGSMKLHTETYMRFAHTLASISDHIEIFTLGTRLTRVTRALRHRNGDQALAVASTLVVDWDGGTRLGDALAAFLSVPRFAGFARGALVVVLSDGLERGDHTEMTSAVDRLSRRSWRIVWLTPLAGNAGYTPQTEALQSILPYIDRLGNGATTERLCHELIGIARIAA